MGQSLTSSAEPVTEEIFAEDGVTVIGSRSGPTSIGVGNSDWQAFPPQSGFVGPGPQINPRVYCTHTGKAGLTYQTGSADALPDGHATLLVLNKCPRSLLVSLGGLEGLQSRVMLVEAGRVCRIGLPVSTSVLFVSDPKTGETLVELAGLPAASAATVSPPRAVLKEMGSVTCACLEYSAHRSKPHMPGLKSAPHRASDNDEIPPLTPDHLALEQQLMEVLQQNDHIAAKDILSRLRR